MHAECEGTPLLYRGKGLLTVSWRQEGTEGSSPVLGLSDDEARFAGCVGSLRHELMRLGQGSGEDLLTAEVHLRNETSQALMISLEFATSARPFPYDDQVLLHLPLSAAGL